MCLEYIKGDCIEICLISLSLGTIVARRNFVEITLENSVTLRRVVMDNQRMIVSNGVIGLGKKTTSVDNI